MVTYYKNFLTPEECIELITLIDAHKIRSTVLEPEGSTATASLFRTSSTTGLSPQHNLVNSIHQRISEAVGIPMLKGEPLQGQCYEPGQYFKAHTDYFEVSAYNQFCLSSGNRQLTFMIYLNDVEEGGETLFPNLNLSVKPERGTAISWPNMENGMPSYYSLHEGTEVKKGSKYVITSWWRENEYNPQKDYEMSLETPKE